MKRTRTTSKEEPKSLEVRLHGSDVTTNERRPIERLYEALATDLRILDGLRTVTILYGAPPYAIVSREVSAKNANVSYKKTYQMNPDLLTYLGLSKIPLRKLAEVLPTLREERIHRIAAKLAVDSTGDFHVTETLNIKLNDLDASVSGGDPFWVSVESNEVPVHKKIYREVVGQPEGKAGDHYALADASKLTEYCRKLIHRY